ncbi:NB-ARC domain-containing protein [Streptomyces sp. PmtG]
MDQEVTLHGGTAVLAGENVNVSTTQAPPPPARPVVTHGLRQDVAEFTGRGTELQQLLDAAAPGRAVAVHTIDGMPGVGKTALVTRAAHLLTERYPDGQYFVDLYAHTPGRPPAPPAEVLGMLLTGLGIDPSNVPPTLEGRSALWRDRLSGKRVLLVLDDAHDPAQIHPLLPGSSGCLTLITSRDRLQALDNADPLALRPLEPEEAVRLFLRLARRTPGADERAAVAETVRLCGHLPLAIVLLAGRLRHKDAWSLARFAADFAAAKDRLDELAAGDRAVRAAFALSYRDLTPSQRRLFRRVSLHPGTTLDVHAAAALDDTSLTAARHDLDVLYTGHLLDEPVPGRYQPHDLLRQFAHALAVDEDPPQSREQAVERLMDYYLYAAERADRHLNRIPRPDTPPSAPPALALPALPGRAEALEWLRAEHLNLLACVQAAGERAPRVVALTAALAAYLRHDGPWQQAPPLHERAAAAAERLGDRSGQAAALNALGLAWGLTGDIGAAREAQQRALTLYEDLGDRLGQANAPVRPRPHPAAPRRLREGETRPAPLAHPL